MARKKDGPFFRGIHIDDWKAVEPGVYVAPDGSRLVTATDRALAECLIDAEKASAADAQAQAELEAESS